MARPKSPARTQLARLLGLDPDRIKSFTVRPQPNGTIVVDAKAIVTAEESQRIVALSRRIT
jgi:hypothetical protein